MTIIMPEAEDVVVEYLRRKLTDPNGRIESKTDTFTATAGQTTFTLMRTKLSHITSCTVNAAAKKIWQDFYIDPGASTSKVIFNSGLTGGETVAITYGYITTGNWIYPQFANTDPNEKSEFPRIAVITVDDPVAYLGSGSSDMRAYPHMAIHTFCESDKITINGKICGGRNAARRLCRYAFKTIKNNWRSELSPVLFDFEVISGPVNIPIDENLKIYRAKADFSLSMVNEGE